MSLRIVTENTSTEVAARSDIPLTELSKSAGIALDTRCGEKGACTGCLVTLQDGAYRVGDKSILVNTDAPRETLACQTVLTSDAGSIQIPNASVIGSSIICVDDFLITPLAASPHLRKVTCTLPAPTLEAPLSDWDRILQELDSRHHIANPDVSIDLLRTLPDVLTTEEQQITVTLAVHDEQHSVIRVEADDTTDQLYSAAVDIGTTTVVVLILDLIHSVVVGRTASYNRQMTLADDVASRISLCSDRIAVDQLQHLIIQDTINPLIDSACHSAGITPGDIDQIMFSGNTVMTHLSLGLNPTNIGAIPFHPVLHQSIPCNATQTGLRINPNGVVNWTPSMHGYIGGDVTADIYTANLLERPGCNLLLDIGTNCEIVLCENATLTACATPAGPAFEGGGILCGCRAADGAIDRIAFSEDGDISWTTIHDMPPVGICGSGIIDFVAGALRTGLINTSGRYDMARLRALEREITIPHNGHPVTACLIVPESKDNSALLITEADIAAILQAKSAVYAGIQTLLAYRGHDFPDINHLILSGGFARFLNLDHAITIGLLPNIPLTRYEVIGNGSLAGAMRALTDEAAPQIFRQIVSSPHIIELNTIPEFEGRYIDALFLPEHIQSSVIDHAFSV